MRYKLGEIFNLQMGKTPDRHSPKFWNEGTEPWISIADLTKCNKYIENTAEKITATAVDESGIKIIPKNTVIMSFKLSIGKVAITPKEMYSNEAIMSFIDKGVLKIEPVYLYYLLMHKDWDTGTNKAVMGKTLNKASLSQMTVNIHGYSEQLEIIKALDAASSIIAARKQQLTELDNLIKARFVEMFGDAEHNTKGFPVAKLADLCCVGSSKRIYQNEQSSEGIPFLRISDLSNRIDKGTKESSLYISVQKYEELYKEGLVPAAGDILITSRGTLGKCYIVKPTDKFYFQDGMISWLSKISKRITSLYISHLFLMVGVQKQIANLQAGSTVAYLSIAMLKNLDIMIPPIQLQAQFAAFVAQVDKSKFVVQQALDKAQLLFDSLMQKYFG